MAAWSTPDGVRARLGHRWASGELPRLALTEFEAIEVPLSGPRAGELAERFDEVRAWVAAWDKAAGRVPHEHFTLLRRDVGGKAFGRNQIPARIRFERSEQLWKFLGVAEDVRRLTEADRACERELPAGRRWLLDHPIAVLGAGDSWTRVLAASRWVGEQVGSGRFLREVPIPGVDTKFIETHRALISGLVDAIWPAARRPEVPVRDFARRYGFAPKPPLVRFRLGCELAEAVGYSDLMVKVSEAAARPILAQQVSVIENETTFLALPLGARDLAVLGAGYGLGSRLRDLDWMRHVDSLTYWGDIDTHGFAILNEFRAAFANAVSIRMTVEVLLAHRDQWVTEAKPIAAHLPNLTEDEARLYSDLVENRYGPQIRLEQERVAL